MLGLAVENAFPMLDLLSELGSSPGEGIAGSFKFKFMATWDLLRSDVVLSRRGDPLLLLDLLSVAFIVAAAARECVEGRGEGVLSRRGVVMATAIDRGWAGGDGLEAGKELRSGGMFKSEMLLGSVERR